MQDVVAPRGASTPVRRLVRYGVTGLALGGLVGYLGALVLPRRYPQPENGYQAPVPVRLVPQQRVDLGAGEAADPATSDAATAGSR
ncbi:hypothetical protein GCM10027446_13320 [Angustibacter peucedani]